MSDLMRFFFSLCACSLIARGATYYVDAAAGMDSNSGTSMQKPWKTLKRANRTVLRSGDHLLFKAGAVWQGQLVPKADRHTVAPIVIDRYGDGPKPKIEGAGQVEDVVRLYNLENLEVRNLEITNQGDKRAVRRGVHLILDNFGTAKHIVVADLNIHDVNGTNGEGGSSKDNGGIIFRTKGNKVASRFDGLTIERNIVRIVDRSGIAAQSDRYKRTLWFPSLHVVIRDNYVDDVGGDGIVPWATDHALIEHNVVRNCNRRAGSYNAGIWPWSTDNSLFQLNEASFTRTTLDGEGFDSDDNSRDTVFQYNYSHDNEGGFMLICSDGRRIVRENIGNSGTVVRYNISKDDHTRAFHLSGAEHTKVDHNFIYVGPKINSQILAVTSWDGWASDALFRNNTFWVLGEADYGHEVKRNANGTYELAPGWGPAKEIVFTGNHYIGRNLNHPVDRTGTFTAAKKFPQLEWQGPQFDATHPEQFGQFIAAHRRWITQLFEKQFQEPLKLGWQ